jgi:hypothetical protein
MRVLINVYAFAVFRSHHSLWSFAFAKQPVDSQVMIDLSNPRLEKIKMKEQQSKTLMAMMKAMLADDDDE